MPLIKSASKAARQENIEREIAAGKDPKQAVAIDFATYDRAAHRLEVGLSLLERSAARLDILDLAGRRVAARTLEASGATLRRVHIDAAAWRSGLYFLQLSQADGRATARAVVVR